MKALLVYTSFVSRVIVKDDWTQNEVIAATRAKLYRTISSDLVENLEEIIDDEECPYDDKNPLNLENSW